MFRLLRSSEKIFLTCVVLLAAALLLACPVAASTLALTPAELVDLINGVADASESWPVGDDGAKLSLPAPETANDGGAVRYVVRVGDLAALYGTLGTDGTAETAAIELALGDDAAIDDIAARRDTPALRSARLFGAVCAAMLMLFSDTTDEFTRAAASCRRFFEPHAARREARASADFRINRMVSMRCTYIDRHPQPQVVRTVLFAPTAPR